ncbi:hypothetical protein CRE_18302 [Caenorhabditis remanei]|uniref:Methyltransferase domain-containing protein n=1 Tax=Caenorhabditis remanei TaxID=31234 RepID=E3NMW4_CAERE|nr:hypothetical protein CRE_18302 [Caenorhabditis remanei]
MWSFACLFLYTNWGHNALSFLQWGARKVIGFDYSQEMIENCKTLHKESENLEFHHKSVTDFKFNEKFHVATAVFVLQYVHDKQELQKAIRLIWEHLEDDGLFVGLIPNGVEGVVAPKNAGKVLGAEIEKRQVPFVDGGLVTANFYEGDKVKCTSTMALHSNEFYEKCFKAAGFSKFEWLAPRISEKGNKVLGEEFLHQFMNPPCDIVFRVWK